MTTWSGEQADDLVEQLGGIALGAELVAARLTKDVVQRLTKRGALHRLCQGVYTSATLWAKLSSEARHRLALRAQQRRDPQLVATGLSAAAVYGLPSPLQPPHEPQLTRRRGVAHRGATGERGVALQRRAWILDDEITVVDGILVTTPARTVIDCARHLDDGWALALGDHAAQCWDGVTSEEILRLIDRAMPSPGHRRARWVALNLDARARCALESLAREVSIRLHLPALTPWMTVGTGSGLIECQVPLFDLENGIVIEVDDPMKYQKPQDLWLEKQREDRLRDLDLRSAGSPSTTMPARTATSSVYGEPLPAPGAGEPREWFSKPW